MQKQKLETPSEWIDFYLKAVDLGPLPESESSLRGSCRCPYPGTQGRIVGTDDAGGGVTGISLVGSRELGPAKVRGRVILLSPASQTPFLCSEPRHLGRVRLVRDTSVCLHSTCISSIKGFLRHLSNACILLSGDLFSDCM